MDNKKLAALDYLNKSFEFNAAFKKSWTDYIELSILESMEKYSNKNLSSKVQVAIVKDASEKIIRLFDPAFWEFQEENNGDSN